MTMSLSGERCRKDAFEIVGRLRRQDLVKSSSAGKVVIFRCFDLCEKLGRQPASALKLVAGPIEGKRMRCFAVTEEVAGRARRERTKCHQARI